MGSVSRIDLEARFASIQRPEPLGKAWADTHIGRIANLANQNGQFPSSVDDVYFRRLAAGYNKDLKDISDTGLQEQEYPARIPLSVFEGDLVANPLFKQTVISSELGVVKSSSQTAIEQHGSATESQTSIFRNSDSNFETTNALASQDKSDDNKGSVETSISKMLEPTYQSSVALLKELQKRKLRLSKERRPDEKPQSRPADPLILAENAVKASNILSSRTEKSLRRASLVLKAIEEHKTPPSNLYESSSFSASHMSSSLSVGMHSLSLSASTETRDASDSKSSKDSVDLLIDKRLKTRQDESSRSNKSLTSSNSLLATLSGKRVSVNSTEASTLASTGQSTELSSLESDGSAKRDNASVVFSPNQDSLTRPETFADAKEGMSSNFLQLEGLSAEDESNTALNASARFQSQMDEFSPIDGDRQLLRSNKYMASSRILNSKSVPSEADESLLDSDVVKFHRSLGAGTVTPLPPAADISLDSANQSKVSNFSTEGREERGDEIPQRVKERANENQSLSSAQVTLSRSDGTSDLVPSMQTDLSKVSNGDRNSSDVSSSGDSETSIVGVSASNPRGIYDIRDSTGPGSSNRKRLISGKRPVSHKKSTRDPTSLYVSESEISLSTMNGEQKKRETETEKRSYFNEKGKDFHRNASNSLSMSEYPVISNIGNLLFKTNRSNQ
ncbi:serine-rich adhesin for platelets-like [Rhopilema esculentum]|uniref:serine-rich adhesin for platelets-like n=1 Tax=Rhopilema esculentum TaxID=499914 RepID=UPI0031E1BCC4